MNQEIFDIIRSKTDRNTKIANEIISILGINRDAAYRRISGQTPLTIEESRKLALEYRFSLDETLLKKQTDVVFLKRPASLATKERFIKYFETIHKTIASFSSKNGAKGYYLARDLPLFYSLEKPELSKLKAYAWSWIHQPKFVREQPSFRDFKPHAEFRVKSQKLLDAYKNLHITEIWTKETINSILLQLQYFRRMKILSKEKFLFILEDLKDLLEQIKIQAEQGKTPSGSPFKLYQSEMFLMDNNFLMIQKDLSTLLAPFNTLDYFEITDENLCQTKKKHVKNILKNSINLSVSNKVERNLFFEKLHSKIHALEKEPE